MSYVKNDPETEQFIQSLEEPQREIYLFMRKEYDILTEQGEHFDEAKNDEYVEQKASEHFDISSEEAGNVFAKTESQIRSFQNYKI
ncbi:hypothetical protein ATL39_1931 [Sinobaca qinghaiensis]|uniref:Uncharacterized protein n=1 Tax=Sinobaca qinghaiensis TaxID=342944 RepID=A0A419V532_9BACL|nr:hypothetical protein [Sinobaca qinghaiensis]RKD73629.1 hypothetical protein ATL39_1931 [Sinobaca qinghaiensis]